MGHAGSMSSPMQYQGEGMAGMSIKNPEVGHYFLNVYTSRPEENIELKALTGDA